MEHRLYKKTGDEVSLLGLGAMRLPMNADGDIDEAAARAMVSAAYAGGVNYYDTAYKYHNGASEPFLGRALAAYPRHSYFLASKLPLMIVESREDALRIFDEQLARCQTDYFDFYLFHAVDADGLKKMRELELWPLLDEKRKSGQIRNLGFSFHDSPEVLAELCADFQWDFAQLMFNYLDAEMTRANEQYAVLQRHKLPCIVMEPVRGGRLANLGPKGNALLKAANPDASVASWALRWVAQHPGVLCILSGMSNMAQLEDNLATLANPRPLSATEHAVLKQAVEQLRSYALIPCSQCKYCMPCPSGVDIPGMMALYNDCALDGDTFTLRQRYREQWPVTRQAHNCVACGECLPKCPQKLPIPDWMTKIHAAAK